VWAERRISSNVQAGGKYSNHLALKGGPAGTNMFLKIQPEVSHIILDEVFNNNSVLDVR
jgi:hypothetical protein